MSDAREIQLDACDKVISWDGRVFATSHLFFNDGDERPVAEVRHGALWFFDEAAMERRDARLAALRRDCPEIGAEKQMEREIVAKLRAAGRPCRQQVQCSRGVIDILVDGDAPALIEVKASVEPRDIATAIGQVILYGITYPGHNRYIALPGKLDAAETAALASIGVQQWT
jgi:hypothetical protein